jgi:hypothetical protein
MNKTAIVHRNIDVNKTKTKKRASILQQKRPLTCKARGDKQICYFRQSFNRVLGSGGDDDVASAAALSCGRYRHIKGYGRPAASDSCMLTRVL